MLLTGYEVPPIHHAAIVIEGNKIVAAGPSSEVKIPAGATVVDTSGRTMLPGLIEAHGHLIVLGHGDYDTWFPWIAAHGGETMLNKVMEISAKQLLMAGVTTTVDLGAPLKPILSIRDRINKGEVVGTRVLASGPWISRGAGGAMQEGFGGINITPAEEAGQQAEELAKAGVDHIKAHSGLTLRRLQGDRRGRATSTTSECTRTSTPNRTSATRSRPASTCSSTPDRPARRRRTARS